MTSTANVVASEAAFRLKAGLFPLTLLEISYYEPEQFDAQLRAKAAEAPGFFQQVPVVLSFEHYQEAAEKLDLAALVAACRAHGLLPVAFRGAARELADQAQLLGLAVMPAARSKPERAETAPTVEAVEAVAELPSAESASGANPSKVITTPIRSGQQVYAPGGDLIVLTSVSAGAEVLADGNIHIYGALRGRALAGVQGDSSARIFCSSLEAELVSIAGIFKLNEDFRDDHWKQAVQLSLLDQSLNIAALI